MSTVFTRMRFFTYGTVLIFSSVVLGLAANFASLFLPHIHRPYTVFAVIVPTATLIILSLVLLRSTPMVDLIFCFVLGVGWLTMGAWSEDVIGTVECFSLTGVQPTKNGTMSAQQYCYEMKSIEAFSWANFAIFAIAFIILTILGNRASSMGRYGAWQDSVSELPWFGEYGGPYGQYPQQQQMYGGGGGYPMGQNGQMPYVIQQAPGHSVVIQPQPGGMPMVTQMPGSIA